MASPLSLFSITIIYVLQIADFGVSDEFQSDDVLLTGSAGTPAFMAPETLKEGADSFRGKVMFLFLS